MGTIPISNPVGVGSIVSFAGRGWKITTVDDPAKVLEVVRHASGKIPKFDSLANEPVHDRLAAMMRNVLLANDLPSYLDARAAEYLFSARGTFQELGLDGVHLLAAGRDTHVLTWTGTAMNSVVAFALTAAGLDCEVLDIGVTVLDTPPDTVMVLLEQISGAPPSINDIADFVEGLRTEKYDELIPEQMLRRLWASGHREQVGMLASLASQLISDIPKGLSSAERRR